MSVNRVNSDGTLTIVAGGASSNELPLGAVIPLYTTAVPPGFLPCNGVQFDRTQFPALYVLLGKDTTPDLRECTLVGAGQSTNDYDADTNPNGIHAHDVYEIGQFKDDQFQGHSHRYQIRNSLYQCDDDDANVWEGVGPALTTTIESDGTNGAPRFGETTHGKQTGVNYIIKAVTGLNEYEAASVIAQLRQIVPVYNYDSETQTLTITQQV